MVEPGRIGGSLGGPGFDVVEAARDAIERYSMLVDDEDVLVAVSGGPDSMCLVDVLTRLGVERGFTLSVAHVDHGLSEGSEDIANRVAKLGAEAGLDVHIARAHDLAGPNLHARAREFRYAFFETIARDIGAAKIATGHTLDDRVETLLARLIHGAAPEGLASIPPASGMRIRPLIGVRRGATRDYCLDRGLPFHNDPANSDERFDRASVRSLVLGPIEERWGDGAIRAIASSAELLREDSDALSALADRVYPGLAGQDEETTTLDRKAMLEMPRALQRRVLERAVGRVRDRSGGIEAVLDALGLDVRRRSFSVAGGVQISIEGDEVRVSNADRFHRS